MKIVKKVAALTAPVVALASSVGLVSAESGSGTTLNINLSKAGFKITDFGTLITGLLNMVMFVSALLVFAYLIWGGIQWITSGGDKGKTEEARNKITAAIIGLAVVAAAYAIFLLAITFLGVSNPFVGGFVIPTGY